MWLASYLALWAIVGVLSFLLLGALLALGRLTWRLEQLEAITPTRLGRSGLKPGTTAPDFTLPTDGGTELSLRDLRGHKVLLVFLQSACKPCARIVPALNRLQRKGTVRVVGVHSGEIDVVRTWMAEAHCEFPIVVQQDLALSRRYQIFATPFAFLINAQGVVESKGLVMREQHVRYVLAGPVDGPATADAGTEVVSAGTEV
jgi:peroxiredoxin